jgi:hypothetical protein
MQRRGFYTAAPRARARAANYAQDTVCDSVYKRKSMYELLPGSEQ